MILTHTDTPTTKVVGYKAFCVNVYTDTKKGAEKMNNHFSQPLLMVK